MSFTGVMQDCQPNYLYTSTDDYSIGECDMCKFSYFFLGYLEVYFNHLKGEKSREKRGKKAEHKHYNRKRGPIHRVRIWLFLIRF